MLDKEIDHIIREAADNHHPVNNNDAWAKMKLKLDKHLPQKKDRKKLLFFLLFFLLLGGGFFITISRIDSNKTGISKANTRYKANERLTTDTGIQNTTLVNEHINNSSNDKVIPQISENQDNNTTGSQKLIKPAESTPAYITQNRKVAFVKKGTSVISITSSDISNGFVQAQTKVNMPSAVKRFNAQGKTNIHITNAEPENNENEQTEKASAKLNNYGDSALEDKKNITLKTTEAKKEKEPAAKQNKKNQSPGEKKSRKNIARNFGLTFSVGPDLSFITTKNPGKTTLMYGTGLSYSFNKRLTVGAGFYVSNKLYSATPDQYHTPGGVVYPYLTGIDANCKVYEIPVTLNYHFGKRKNHNWFGSAGLSTLLMKTENYKYLYKTPSGQTYDYKYSVTNKNKHYLAVLTISGGYQYNLGKKVSVTAAPYIKLPLTGIGFGKIKLNSSGILFTVTVNPFAKN